MNQTLDPIPSREKREHDVFLQLLKLCYGLEQRLLDASSEEVELIADLVSQLK